MVALLLGRELLLSHIKFQIIGLSRDYLISGGRNGLRWLLKNISKFFDSLKKCVNMYKYISRIFKPSNQTIFQSFR